MLLTIAALEVLEFGPIFVSLTASGVSATAELHQAIMPRIELEFSIDALAAPLRDSAVECVLLRPGGLVDVSGTGKVGAGIAFSYGDLPRENLAAALVEVTERPSECRMIIDITQGNTPWERLLKDWRADERE